MYRVVMVRHGQSEWNQQNLFTGWTDVDLTERGLDEAREAGQILRETGYIFDAAFASVLQRSIKTLYHVLDELGLLWIPVEKSWKLNERHYGALQGLSKSETAEKYGEEQVHIWRRSLNSRPPLLEAGDKRRPQEDARYSKLDPGFLPAGESLQDTIDRVGEYWDDRIVPLIRQKERIIIAAHGNTIRALIKFMEDLEEHELLDLNIPTGVPLVYELDDEIKPIRRFYLGHPTKVEEKKREAADPEQNPD
ncbi:2,3-diphosphoglycerate-dependent phosphoglycerate mutase [Saccharibacillus sp. CPCC 101409]|uniref:2,3-diphosphoglycerate-dependent phosphoglycerate mutase n=1 Tax=Saccharibacillus sp. CPCC 101409 TaxID=3058041 RepID=UPI002671B31A|nr:2,3-diphosphoglycerate-dependent phosphoglycerate mutase [Saccharibacillus sp. CPCC 101409]MDO3408463.1 2,3-diphosphoglycerate-dependent phosphoglycerate mutase [Saccharibacillus sp. CPCC 101409]